MSHHELHRSHRTGWLRAAVMGANDGIVSTASLIIGVAAAGASSENIALVGVAGLVAGAMSMAAGEYVSVSSQSDTVKADLLLEQHSIDTNLEYEIQELVDIYRERGLDDCLAVEVAEQLMAHDALGAHARDELGISDLAAAKPVQAAVSSALAFSVGALLPLLVAIIFSDGYVISSVALASLFFLASLGGLAAYAGGAPKLIGAARVTFWGVMAMLLTALVGHFFDAVF